MKVILLLFAAALYAQTDGLERYYLVFIRPVADRKAISQAETDRIQSAHMANIGKMARENILVAAGPMEDDPITIAGIFVFKAESLEEARRIAAQDPTVLEHRDAVDVYPWWGPKGIGVAYFQSKKDHPDSPEKMTSYAFCLYLKGPNWIAADRGHSEWVERLHGRGMLTAAGPIEEADELVGISIFKTSSIDAAQRLIVEDPAIDSGLLRAEFHQWWSADGVMPW